jgi:hypothetical protein
MIQSFPSGSQVVLPFYFAKTKLTAAQQQAYEEGAGLPSGVGEDPHTIKCLCWEPETSEPIEATVTRVGAGEYTGTVEAVKPGQWWWQGQGLTAAGKFTGSTRTGTFEITAARSS